MLLLLAALDDDSGVDDVAVDGAPIGTVKYDMFLCRPASYWNALVDSETEAHHGAAFVFLIAHESSSGVGG